MDNIYANYKIFLEESKTRQGNDFSDKTINDQIKFLSKSIPSKLNSFYKTNIYRDLFLETSLEKIKKLKNVFSRKGELELYTWDQTELGKGGASSSLFQYINFLKSRKLDFDGFSKYLNKKNYRENTIKNNISYLKNSLMILNQIDSFNGSDTEKILNFANQDKSFKQEFDKYHNYSSNNTYTDFNGAAKKYKEFLLEKNSFEDKGNKTMNNIKNIILYGAPGVGKTHNYKKLISLIEEGKSQKETFDTIKENKLCDDANDNYLDVKNEKRVEFITFHQSFGYEDFIEGFRPNENGNIQLENGIFKNISLKAMNNLDKNFYLVIDEINRGNISKIFGELITLIEESKRDDYEVILPYSKEKFSVPSNLYIIGTMNTTDKSIALIDVALRRRFTFIKMQANPDLVVKSFQDTFIKLNEQIEKDLGEEYQIGHSYFMNIEESDLDFVKEYKIKPLLEEYYYGDEKLKDVLNILELED